jgi:predicted RNase H-like nuclease
MKLIGADGCKDGWICISQHDAVLSAWIVPRFRELLARASAASIVAIDVPIGLTDAGPRSCDVAARRFLREPRRRSVFSAPVRCAIPEMNYHDECAAHFKADGRKLSQQAFAIIPKIRDVDEVVAATPSLQKQVREIHPEVSFAVWNSNSPMQHKKKSRPGRTERERLIEDQWPGWRSKVIDQLQGKRFAQDDLNDAFAALWTAGRIASGIATVLPAAPPTDRFGIRMEMWA